MLDQLKKGFELALEYEKKEKKKMDNKVEIMSNELAEINNIIAIAKADSEVEQILLSEVAREFGKERTEEIEKQVFFQDMVYEVIELAKHDSKKRDMLFIAILEDDKIGTAIQDHFYEYFSSNGQIRQG